MKNIVLGTLIAAASLPAIGCTVSSTTNDVAFVTVGWRLKTAANDITTTCPPGFDTAALYSQEVDSTGVPFGSPIIDLFDCAAGVGQTAPLAPSYYDEWIEIATHDNSSQFARSLDNLEGTPPSTSSPGVDDAAPVILDLTTSDLTYDTEVVVDGGYFRAAWNLVGASSGAALSCGAAGAGGGVEVVSSGTSSFSDIFTCSHLEGLTLPVPTGTYTISVDALNTANPPQAIGTAPALTNMVIEAPGALHPVTELGTITIPITGM